MCSPAAGYSFSRLCFASVNSELIWWLLNWSYHLREQFQCHIIEICNSSVMYWSISVCGCLYIKLIVLTSKCTLLVVLPVISIYFIAARLLLGPIYTRLTRLSRRTRQGDIFNLRKILSRKKYPGYRDHNYTWLAVTEI